MRSDKQAVGALGLLLILASRVSAFQLLPSIPAASPNPIRIPQLPTRQPEKSKKCFADEVIRRNVERGAALGMRATGATVGVADKLQYFQRLRGAASEDEVVDIIEQLKENFDLNVKDYTTILASLKRFKSWKRALAIFDEVRQRGVEPNTITYNVVMGTCGAAGRYKETLQLFQDMQRRGYRADDVTYALEVLTQMKAQRMQITEGVYTAGIMACEKGGQWVLALELLREMHLKDITPSLFAYNAAIFACRKDRQWIQATALLGEMRQDGLSPDRNSYHGAMGACEEAEMTEGVMDLFEEMRAMGIEPSRQSYEYVTKACREYLFTHGDDDRLKAYLRTNSLTPNILSDESDVIVLKQPKLLEYVGGGEQTDEQPTYMSLDEE